MPLFEGDKVWSMLTVLPW